MNTIFFVKKYPELSEVVNKYNLDILLDEFGMSKTVFYKGKEIGYWFHSDNGIEMNYTKEFGLYNDKHNDYDELANGIEKRIEEKLNKEK